MPKVIEALTFDSKLFQINVGRIDLVEEDLATLHNVFPTMEELLQQAHSSGFKLIYLMSPVDDSSKDNKNNITQYPGKLVDNKTTYIKSLRELDYETICKRAFATKEFFINQLQPDINTKEVNSSLLELAIASGSSSRFKVDEKLPERCYHDMFKTWLINSIYNKLADATFVAYDKVTHEEIGFITVKRKETVINIGLLAVNSKYRRLGIASSLLSRAVLFALEALGDDAESGVLQVITQGNNIGACRCYENFGFTLQSTQQIYHIHLPEDLAQYQCISVADQQLCVPFCRQHFTGKEKTYLGQLLDSCSIDSAGHYNLSCQAKLKDLLGDSCSRALVVPSGTAALELAALLCDLKPGDEVVMPSYTFSSTANAFVLRGAVPVFVDVKAEDLNMDERRIEAAITGRTRVICAVHYGGVACDMDAICDIASRHGLLVVEDAAQAFLSSYKGRPLGTLGDFGCFSFHYTKNVVCGEGGALSVNKSEERARRALVMWEKGTNRYDFLMGKVSKYEWIDVGSSFVPSELLCAVLLAQLEGANQITQRRLQHFHRYQRAFQAMIDRSESRHVSTAQIPEHVLTNGHIFYLLFVTADHRAAVQSALKLHGVSSFTHYVPLHSSPAGRKYGRFISEEDMQVTNHVHECLLRLPMWTDLTDETVDKIIDIVEAAVALF